MSQRIQEHSVEYTFSVAQRASTDVTHFLLTAWEQTVAVHNVEEDPAYQEHDIDLLWTVKTNNNSLRVILLEVKGDRYHQTGNFFFETISNESKGTQGCILYTKADWLFYYFVEIGRLYCLPTERVRPWFEANSSRFAERRTSTPTRYSRYITVGRLVPIQTVLQEVMGVMQYQKTANGEWETI